MPDFLKIFQQVQQMQGRLQQLQEELQRVAVTGASGGGMISVEADGKGQIRRISIDPAAVDPADVEMLETLILAAVTEAQKRAAEAAQVEMRKLTGGLDLPFPLQLPV
jgi:DNA-binding YbaB/EbfC family protein